MKKIYLFLAALFFAIFIFGCTKEDPQTPPPLVNENNNGFESFKVAEIFARTCATSDCHAGPHPIHHLSFETHAKMIEGGIGRPLDDSGGHDHGPGKKLKTAHGGVYGGGAVIPFDAENSLLYRLVSGNVEDQSLAMPYNANRLTAEETGILKDWINNGARDNNGNVPYSNPDNKIYVCNQGSDQIYEIDTDYNLVSRIISVDYNSSVIEAPHNVQIYGNYYYITLIATGQLLKIDRNTNSVVGAVGGIEYAGMINISPDGKTAYVSRSSTAPGSYQKIYAVNTESMTIKGEINFPIAGLPHAIWLTKNGDKLYVANMTRDRISIVSTSTLEIAENDILLSLSGSTVHEPMHIYLSPDDKYLYVNCRLSSKMLIINTETKNIVQELTIKHHPMQAAISEDGNKIYVVSHHEPVITEITKSGESWAITREFTNDAFHHLYGADLSPDGKFLYVTCSNQTNEFKPRYHVPGKIAPSLVCVYDVNTGDLVKIIDVGSFATGIAARQNWK